MNKTLKLEDLILIKDMAKKELLEFPHGAKFKRMDRALNMDEIIVIGYFNAVVSILNQKGLLKEEFFDSEDKVIDLHIPDSSTDFDE